MDATFFTSIVLFWCILCLGLFVLARWCANAAELPAPDVTTATAAQPAPRGESLSAARLAAVLIGVTVPPGILWLASEPAPSSLNLISIVALVGAFLIGLAHAIRRGALDADVRGER